MTPNVKALLLEVVVEAAGTVGAGAGAAAAAVVVATVPN